MLSVPVERLFSIEEQVSDGQEYDEPRQADSDPCGDMDRSRVLLSFREIDSAYQ